MAVINFSSQVIGKMLSLFLNRSKLRHLKDQILEDAAFSTCDESELSDKKKIRILIVTYFTYFMLTVTLILAFPLITSDEFAMPAYLQLPHTK